MKKKHSTKKKPTPQNLAKPPVVETAAAASTVGQDDKIFAKNKAAGEPSNDLNSTLQSSMIIGGLDKRLHVLETINRFSEEYLAGLMEDDPALDDRVRQEMPSRLEALQKQLEHIELESFTKQRLELIAKGNGGDYETNDALVASLNTKASQTEISLSTLKTRLSEMHQKLIAKQQTTTVPVADKKVAIPGKVKIGEFPAEGDAFDDETDMEGSDDYFDSGFDTDEYLDEVENGVLRTGMIPGGLVDMRQIISAAQKDIDNASNDGYDLVTKAESELQSVLAIFSSPNMTLEEKLQSVQPKLREVIQQDLYWRSQSDKLNRRVHDLRLQKRLSEMERDRLRSINGRLEGFCRDLQSENRKIKLESAKVEEAMKTAIELAATIPQVPLVNPAVPVDSTSSKKDKKKNGKGKDGTTTSSPPQSPNPSFALPNIPSRSSLEAEDKAILIDRLLCLTDLYQARENHFNAISEARELESKICDTKISQQQILLERTISKLDLGESRVNELARSEAELKTQVRQYVEKFRQVEETLVKSNELFGTFRGEMEQMSLKLARFERENHQMQGKCQTLSRNIIEMVEERTKLQASIETLKGQKVKLENLCRTLQAERNTARKTAEDSVGAEAVKDENSTSNNSGNGSATGSNSASNAEPIVDHVSAPADPPSTQQH